MAKCARKSKYPVVRKPVSTRLLSRNTGSKKNDARPSPSAAEPNRNARDLIFCLF